MPYTRIMSEELSFPPGRPIDRSAPLARFLPPLESGVVLNVLERVADKGSLIVDPFGVSPTLVLEAARAGYAVLVATGNPINGFLIQLHANPIDPALLRMALARFANAPKDGRRMEPFLLDLYRTMCSRCGARISADYFIWERDAEEPLLKGYSCDRCGHAVEEATNEMDRGLARSYSGRGLHYAMALEQLASRSDPYRMHAENALNVYTGRSLYALITLLSKLNQLDLDDQTLMAARALLLYACDACNALWSHPEGRLHPRRLSLSPQYRETNVWRAMERAIQAWSFEGPPIPVNSWSSESLPDSGTVSIYPGSGRFLRDSLEKGSAALMLSVLPRPSQAYWTLAAMWTAWLWGQEEASSIKVALRRRRYDWSWHARALLMVLEKVVDLFEDGTPAFVYLPDVDPGFLGAALAGLDGAGFRLTGSALRVADEQAILRLETSPLKRPPKPIPDFRHQMSEAAVKVLERRGEPAPYLVLHAAVWTRLAEARQLAPFWHSEDGNPIPRLSDELEAVLRDSQVFQRIGKATEIEHGLYWLTDPCGADEPLSDQIEESVLGLLRQGTFLSEKAIFDRIYGTYSGLLTPDKRFLDDCLISYAEKESEEGIWRLHDQDQSDARAADIEEMRRLLVTVGARLGFEVEGDEVLLWIDNQKGIMFQFRVQETAKLAEALIPREPPLTFVLPGGRALLVMAKIRRDPRLAEWITAGGRIIKYRHVRRLFADTTLSRENLMQRIAIDPPDHQDPQLPLL